MPEPKTKPTEQNPVAFLETIAAAQRRADALKLLELFEEATGEKPVMWGSNIVGFGQYFIDSGKSNQKVSWPLSGFSPRKQNLTLYVISGNTANEQLLKKLGKHTTSTACLYLNKLADVDLKILSQIIKNSYLYEKARLGQKA